MCADPKLSALDSKLAGAYAATRAQLSPASSAQLQTDQREWLHFIDGICPPHPIGDHDSVAGCLTEHCNTRLNQLLQGTQREAGMLFFTRAHFVLVEGAPPAKGEFRAGNDPGFGYGEFAWPQIDNATPAEQAWDDAVYKQAYSWQVMGRRSRERRWNKPSIPVDTCTATFSSTP